MSARHVCWFVEAAKTRGWAGNEPARFIAGDDSGATDELVNFRTSRPCRALCAVESLLDTSSGFVNDVVLLPALRSAFEAVVLRDGFVNVRRWLVLRRSASRNGDRLRVGTGLGTCPVLRRRRSITPNGFEPEWLSTEPRI